jgi:hypothetical protein
MNLKRKAALYTLITTVILAIWLFSLAAWYAPTLLFTLVFLWFVALPFCIYNLILINLKGKQDSADYHQKMKDLLAKNKKASDKVQQTIDAMREKND